MKQRLILFITFFLALSSYGRAAELKGNVINSATNEPLAGVLVTLIQQNRTETTNANGEFYFKGVTPEKDVISFNSANIMSKEMPIEIGANLTTLPNVQIVVISVVENSSLIGALSDFGLDDDNEGSSQEISSMVILSNDVYRKNAGYQLSQFRFKVRGYDNYYEQKFINGVNFNNQLRGVFNFASIGALNDMTRNGDAVNFHSPSLFTFGSIGGSENINMRAGSYAKGSKVTLSYTNRNYYLRGMATYSTGLQDNGWAFSASVGGRYSDEGNIDGTFYSNFSYALALEKQWKGGEHSLSFVTFGSPVKRGQQGASFQEAYDLVNDNLYNPNWGYQNGKKRNSKVVSAYDPTAIVSHIWKINRNVTLTSGFGIHYGRYGATALNWYNAADPRPDYYRSLPSYQQAEDVKDRYIEAWENLNPSITQVNWDKLYHANQLARREGEGAALYMVEERRSDLFENTLNSTLNVLMNDNHKLTAGLGLRTTESKQFKTVNDLLGAEYVLDIDKFAERDFQEKPEAIQNDLNRPNRKVYEDDIFGYDFRLNINNANVWIQDQYTTQAIDFYYGAKVSYTDFQRKGKMKNGRYPDSSEGKGKQHSFVDFGIKAGITYKINGRHFISGNINYATEAPLANNAYISPRISDNTMKDLESGKVFSADLSYIFSLKSLSGRVSVFQTNFYDQISRISYYHDAERTFINHTLSNMNKVNHGIELGLSYRLTENWSFDLAGTLAEYYYNNNPDGSISYENGKKIDIEEKVYLKDYYVGGTPQIAGTLGVNYFYKYWFVNLHVNGLGRNYIGVAPLRRLASNYTSLDPGNPADLEAYNILTDQERFGSSYTVDISIGKVLFLPNGRSMNFNFAFNNLFNRENVRTGGYEQGRLDITAPRKFASKYYYMQGFNCFLNASYRF